MKLIVGLCILLAASSCSKGKALSSVERMALFKAVSEGSVLELKSALDSGVSPNLYHAGRGSLVFEATAFGNQQALKILIDAGADVNAKDREGNGPLIVAILGARCEEAKMLLQAGADANEVFPMSVAAEAAIGTEYHGKTARELYFIRKQRALNRWQENQECWLIVEGLLAKK